MGGCSSQRRNIPGRQDRICAAILAKHVIAAAMEGERDLGRLSDGALLALAQSNLRSGSASLLS
jgi:hypothetical protein